MSFNIDQILNQLKTDRNVQNAGLSGLAGLAAGMLLSGNAGKALGNVAKIGAVAAVGGLAWKAWKTYEERQGGQRLPDEPPADFVPRHAPEREQLGKSMVRAMIAATKADGHIDGDEKQKIFAKLETMNLSAEEKAFVFDELSGPLDIDAVAARGDTPEHAAEIYAASLAAVTVDDAAERTYLAELAGRLRLPPGLVEEIHSQAGVTPPATAGDKVTPRYQRGPGGANI